MTDSPDAWTDIRFARDDCVKLLWRRCGSAVLQRKGEDSDWLGHHEVDLSHLSNSGLMRQGIVSKSVVPSLSDQQVDRTDVAKQMICLLTRHPNLSMDQKRNLEKMSRVLENAEKVHNGPSEESDRRGACDELLAMMSRVLQGLKTQGDMAEFVAASLAEAAAHCWTAWEEAVHSAYHVVCPDAAAPSHVMTMELEDWLLGELLSFRRDLGYRALAKAKEQAGETDVHFKNFFFSSLHFGLPLLQRMAAKDPSRLNYTMLNLVNMDEVRADLWKEYTPASIVAHVRGLLDSSAYWRGRVVDWLRARCVDGLESEQWLYEWCHDADYSLRDEAIVFMLASMRILDGSTLCEIRPPTVPRRTGAPWRAPLASATGVAARPDQVRPDPVARGAAERPGGLCAMM